MVSKKIIGLSVASMFNAIVSSTELNISAGKLQQNGFDVLNAVGIANAGSYGCWCRRIGGNAPIGAGVLNEIDAVCKRWFQSRRCLTLNGGSCSDEVDDSYSVDDVSDYNTVTGVNQCGTDTGMVDLYFANLLKDTADSSTLNLNVVSLDSDCAAIITPLAKEYCVGSAPDSLQAIEPPCVNGSLNGNTCTCNAGWQGATCDTQIPCVNGSISGYNCVCDSGFEGAACDQVTCINGSVSGSTCTCDAGYQGLTCDTAIPCVNGNISGNTCVCASGYEGAACDQVAYPDCGENRQYDPASGQCEKCYRQTICPTNYLATQPSSCFGGPSTSCISMCLLGERLGYLKLYEFEVNDGLFAVDGDSGSGVWYDRNGHLGNVPEEMWSTEANPTYFARFGNWWKRPVRYHIDGANSGKVIIYRMFRTNAMGDNGPIINGLVADGYTQVAEHPDGTMYNANGGYGDFVAYKKLVDVNGLLEISTETAYWTGGVAFKLDCSETA